MSSVAPIIGHIHIFIKNTKEVYFIVIRFLFKNLVNISFFKNLVIIFKNLVNKCLLKNLVNLAVLPDFFFASCLDFFEKSDLIFTLYSLAME